MPFSIQTASHRHAELIVQGAFRDAWEQLVGVLEHAEVPLRAAGPYDDRSRPKIPKRQLKNKQKDIYAVMPIDQNALNDQLDAALGALEGWATQPLVLGRTLGRELESFLKGDFAKGPMYVEVEFGNTASMFRDLFKFQLASQSKKADVAVLVVATAATTRLMDSNVASFERAVALLPFLDLVVALPTLIVGIEPRDWEPVRARYNEMKTVAEEHGVKCFTFDEAARLPAELEELEVALAAEESLDQEA